MYSRLVEQMAASEGITEELKAKDQMTDLLACSETSDFCQHAASLCFSGGGGIMTQKRVGS